MSNCVGTTTPRGGPLAFYRKRDDKQLLWTFNMTHDVRMLPPAGGGKQGTTLLSERVVAEKGALHFEAPGVYIVQIE